MREFIITTEITVEDKRPKTDGWFCRKPADAKMLENSVLFFYIVSLRFYTDYILFKLYINSL